MSQSHLKTFCFLLLTVIGMSFSALASDFRTEISTKLKDMASQKDFSHLYSKEYTNLSDPLSPEYDEDKLIILIEEALKTNKLEEADRLRGVNMLKMLGKNRPGMKITDFDATDINDKKTRLSKFLSKDKNLIIFYDPDCGYCMEMFETIDKARLEEKYNIIAVDAVEDTSLWDSTKRMMPEYWTAIHTNDSLEDLDLYYFPVLPQIYITDKKGVILVKNPPVTNL